MQKRKFDELISYFNRKVSEMSIDRKYKMELLGMISAIGFAHEKKLSTNLAEVGTDCIGRQAAIDAICNACGKIDCDKMDKCEKLQLPPASCSEFPNNSDTISREAVEDAINGIECTRHTTWYEFYQKVMTAVEKLPSAEKTATVSVGKSKGGVTMWYECAACGEPVDQGDTFCSGCGRRLIHE